MRLTILRLRMLVTFSGSELVLVDFFSAVQITDGAMYVMIQGRDQTVT